VTVCATRLSPPSSWHLADPRISADDELAITQCHLLEIWRISRKDPYSQSDVPFCTFPAQGNPYACSFTLASGKSQPIQPTKGNFNVAISADILVWSSCGGGTGLTIAELYLNTQGNDWYDVSLVNGFNYGVSIQPSSGNGITVTSATGNAKNPGVYPLGCDICTGPSNPPTGPGCPGKNYPQEGHVNTQPPCQFNQLSVASYAVTLTNPQ
jgi:Thaumatin family